MLVVFAITAARPRHQSPLEMSPKDGGANLTELHGGLLNRAPHCSSLLAMVTANFLPYHVVSLITLPTVAMSVLGDDLVAG